MDYKKYMNYIKNVGQRCKIEWFDNDWCPIGSIIRKELKQLNYIKENNGYIEELK
ncbi:hypothetical protein LCGC14_1194940 [marine sediment metagenome]|uniref:Uncharacterized protein n=1 Tax=marine sediment metagenome TaxID=412755 RepID=A0A0F9PNP4_9ZZZZ